MTKIQETLSVTIDEQTYNVADLSQNTQQLIRMMDSWRQKDADLTDDLLMVRAALRDIQNTLLTTIKDEVAQQAQEPAANEQSAAAAE